MQPKPDTDSALISFLHQDRMDAKRLYRWSCIVMNDLDKWYYKFEVILE